MLRTCGFVLMLVWGLHGTSAFPQTRPGAEQAKETSLQILRTANNFFAAGDYDDARKAYLQALPAFSKNAEVLKNLAFCYFSMGRAGYPQAAQYYSRAYEIDPSDRDVAEKLATCYLSIKRPADAASILKTFVERPGAPPEAWKKLADAYVEAGNAAQAESAYEAYLDLRPGDLAARTKLAGLYRQEKEYDKAKEQVRLVLLSNPNYTPALVVMGRILSSQGQYEDSLKLYDQALRLNPSNGEAASQKAFVLLWMGKPEEAAPLFAELHRRYPNDVEISRGLDATKTAAEQKSLDTARQSGNVARLEALYRERLDKNPRDLDALKALVVLTSDPKRCAECIDLARRGLEIAPEDPALQIARANSLASCQRNTEAIDAYRHYLELRPKSADAIFGLAQILYRERRIDEATQAYRDLLQLNPNNRDASLGLAQCLAASKNYPEALIHYDEALKSDPNNYDALQGKGYVLYWTGRFAEAKAIFENLAAQRPGDAQNQQTLQSIADAEEAARWAALRPPANAPPKDFVVYYKKRLASYPDDVPALKALAYLQEEERDYESALQTYKEVLQKKPDDPDARTDIERVNKYLAYNSVSNARTLAYNGGADRQKALEILKAHLDRYPDDTEARILYGSVLSWEGRYDDARAELKKVLGDNPTNADALPALINTELWSDHPQRAADLAETGLQKDPKNVTYLMDKAHALRNMGSDREALTYYKRAVAVDPSNKDLTSSLWNYRKTSGDYTEFKIDHTYEFFNKILGGQNETSLSVRTPTPAGSVTFRESRADRFASTSYLSEIDFWPSFRPGTYGYVNVGYSPDAVLYPRTRFGFDLYQDTHGYEFSGGYRFMHFASDVNIYTFAVSKYKGKWFFTERTFLTPGSPGLSDTEVFTVRRFFGDEGLHDYVEAFFSRGASPAQARTTLNIQVLDSYRGGIALDKVVGHFSVSLKAAMGREAQTYASDLRRYTLEGQIYYRF